MKGSSILGEMVKSDSWLSVLTTSALEVCFVIVSVIKVFVPTGLTIASGTVAFSADAVALCCIKVEDSVVGSV